MPVGDSQIFGAQALYGVERRRGHSIELVTQGFLRRYANRRPLHRGRSTAQTGRGESNFSLRTIPHHEHQEANDVAEESATMNAASEDTEDGA